MIRTKTEEAINDARILAESIIETIDESLLILDENLRIVSGNKAFFHAFSVLDKETKGKVIYEIGNGQWNINLLRKLLENIIPKDGQVKDFEVRHNFPHIGVKIMILNARRINQEGGRRKLILLAIKDITEQKLAEEHVQYISFHDAVTGLYNRAFFEEELRRQDTERELPLSIIMGDVNNLKRVNDTFGHAEGDKLLKKVAEILKASCRSNDVISRWGGDEYVIILPKTANAAAKKITGKVKQKCREVKGMAIQPSIALGIGTKVHRDDKIARILRDAEGAMYEDKDIESKTRKRE